VDSGGGESSLSFLAQAPVPPGANTNCVVIDGIGLPVGGVSFHVYRGTVPELLFRIASYQTPAPAFTDTGMLAESVLSPDPQFDHVNVEWRWELLPETPAAIHSATTVGNPGLQLKVNQYQAAVVRVTRGTGAGQECAVLSNTPTTVTIGAPWSIEPDATSWFVIAENSWRFGAKGIASPIAIDVPERIGAGVEISARAANSADEEAAYALSPLTRWVLGQSGGLMADSDVPPAATFGVSLSAAGGGALDLGTIAFSTLNNTRGIIAGTYRFHYYDEIIGDPPLPMFAPIAATDTSVAFGTSFASGELVQIEREIVQIVGTNPDGTAVVIRGAQGTPAADHALPLFAYHLTEKVAIVPFIRNFFGSPASGDWKSSVTLPNIRLASAEFYLTNALGDGAITANVYTGTNDFGLRTLAGGQFSFQITGYLAIQTNAAPIVVVDTDRAVRDIYGILSAPPVGAAMILQINCNGAPYATVQFADGSTVSNTVDGFGMSPLRAGDHLSLNIGGVGTTVPGSDLTLIVRL
jgi:hypothetical protein